MGYGQAEQSHKKRKGKAVAREGASEPEEEEEQEVPKKVLFKRGERVAIGASGGKGELRISFKAICNAWKMQEEENLRFREKVAMNGSQTSSQK